MGEMARAARSGILNTWVSGGSGEPQDLLGRLLRVSSFSIVLLLPPQ